jgi:serine/threonine-protein kinase
MDPGQTIVGKYRLNVLLGMGGMASVWSATNIYTERKFAIKFMLPQVARTPEAVQRFMLEAKVSARINHPNIIEVIDVGQTEDGTLFLVMELLTGAPLDAAVRDAQPAMLVRDFLLVMRDVARGLAAAHHSGVIHRDLKPTNVFLHRDRDGHVVPKVLDFGVSKVLEGDASGALTIDGTILGSRDRRAHRRVRLRSDVVRGSVRRARVLRVESQCSHRDDRDHGAKANRRAGATVARAASRAGS